MKGESGMKFKNLKIYVPIIALEVLTLVEVIPLRESVSELHQETVDISKRLDQLDDGLEQLDEQMILNYINAKIKEETQVENKEKTMEELLEEKTVYREISEYISEITEEDMEAFLDGTLDHYGITSQKNTFRFDPNNFSEAKARIETYAKQMDSLENQTHETEYFIKVTDDDQLVEKYRSDYLEKNKDVTEEELQEAERSFREKAAAVYYTKMNYKYLNNETLRKINETYQLVEDSKNLNIDILNYVNQACIVYYKTPLMKEMVANMGVYTAHSLLDANMNAKRWSGLIGDNGQVVERVIRGDFRNGEERKEKLGKEGYNYYAVQEAVNLELGVVTKKKTALYRIENGKIVSNLPVLPTEKDVLCKYVLIERRFQKRYLENTVIYGDYNTYHAPLSYNPQMVLINEVVGGHMEEIHYMLMDEGTESIENTILNEIQLHSPLDLFEIVESVEETTGNKKKLHE